MSANAWSDCPVCYAARVAKREHLWAELEKDYGRVPPDVYAERRTALESAPLLQFGCDESMFTLREDYEAGVDEDGVLRIKYRARCSECGWEHEFSHIETVVAV